MENSHKTRTIIDIIALIAVIFLGYFAYSRYYLPRTASPAVSTETGSEVTKVEVEHTKPVSGILPAPTGFPQDIPLENVNLTESVTTNFPGQHAQQLSLSYKSTKTVTQKYSEYKDYMQKNGYKITEGDPKAPVRAIFGSKNGTNLSVVISSAANMTLVQLSYLLTGV